MDVHPPKYSKIGFDTSPYNVWISMHIIDRYLFDEYDTQYGYDIIQLWICMGDSYHPKIIKPILTCATVKLHGSHGINRGGGHTSLWKWIDDPSCEHGTYKVYICAYIYIFTYHIIIYIYVSGGQDYYSQRKWPKWVVPYWFWKFVVPRCAQK